MSWYLLINLFIDIALALCIMRTLTNMECEEEFILNISSVVFLVAPRHILSIFEKVKKASFWVIQEMNLVSTFQNCVEEAGGQAERIRIKLNKLTSRQKLPYIPCCIFSEIRMLPFFFFFYKLSWGQQLFHLCFLISFFHKKTNTIEDTIFYGAKSNFTTWEYI